MNPRIRFDAAPTPTPVVPVESLPLETAILRPGFEADASQRPAVLDLLEALPSEQVFIPDGYEPNYAYPLLIWLLPATSSRLELPRLMGQVSHRNHLGLAFLMESGDLAATGTALEELVASHSARLLQTVRRFRRAYHVHSERVYLAGFGAAGSFALALGLSRPEWFAGIAALGSRMPECGQLLSRLDDLRGKRVFLSSGQKDRQVAPAETSRISRLLQSAGLRVCHRVYDAGHEVTRPMLLELDRWVMKDIYEAMNV